MDPWRKNPVIYEINTWVWLGELTSLHKEPITLHNIPEEVWNGLAEMHIDAVWFMGVWERSPGSIRISNQHPGNLSDFYRALPDFTPEDNVGSPYCIRRYAVDQHLGGNDGLATARAALASRNIKLVLDYVPNHLAHDHPWVCESPDFFIQGNRDNLANDPVTFVKIGENIFACGKDPFYPAWQDVLQVNIFYPALREAIVETMKDVSGMCDGVRCDMAMLVINDVFEKTWGTLAGPRPETEFWEVMIPAVRRANSDFLFIAEAYWDKEYELQRMGFDFCYDKRLYDRLVDENAPSVRTHLIAGFDYQSKLLRFTENHDEPRQAVTFPPGRSKAATVIASTLPGAKLFHEGQFEGLRTKLPVFLRRRPTEPVDLNMRLFCNELLEILNSPPIHDGDWHLETVTGWDDNQSCQNLLAWQWTLGASKILIIVNYSDFTAQGRVKISDGNIYGTNWFLQDAFTHETYYRNGTEMCDPGLFVSLGPWQFHLFSFYPD